jgi:hypothetical protein
MNLCIPNDPNGKFTWWSTNGFWAFWGTISPNSMRPFFGCRNHVFITSTCGGLGSSQSRGIRREHVDRGLRDVFCVPGWCAAVVRGNDPTDLQESPGVELVCGGASVVHVALLFRLRYVRSLCTWSVPECRVCDVCHRCTALKVSVVADSATADGWREDPHVQ